MITNTKVAALDVWPLAVLVADQAANSVANGTLGIAESPVEEPV